jgi:hypothetical protein
MVQVLTTPPIHVCCPAVEHWPVHCVVQVAPLVVGVHTWLVAVQSVVVVQTRQPPAPVVQVCTTLPLHCVVPSVVHWLVQELTHAGCPPVALQVCPLAPQSICIDQERQPLAPVSQLSIKFALHCVLACGEHWSVQAGTHLAAPLVSSQTKSPRSAQSVFATHSRHPLAPGLQLSRTLPLQRVPPSGQASAQQPLVSSLH